MSVESEYDDLANEHRTSLTQIISRARVIVGVDGIPRLDDVTSAEASRMFGDGYTTLQISGLLGVPEGAVYNGIHLYRKYEKELSAQ